ncbi:MAG TPA: hypothetical protein VF502_19105 [Stellaceae bacterium]
MTQKKERQRAPKRETRRKAARPGAKASGAARHPRDGDSLVEATHQVIEDEVRRGEAPAAPGPDQKGEPGSSV